MSILSKIFGNKDAKSLKAANRYLARINDLEDKFSKFSEEELKQTTKNLIRAYEQDNNLENLIPDAFAAVRESSKRNIGLRHYDCQILGGIVLHNGSIAEMATGEGKTLAATLPCYLNALTKKSVLVITANEYLAERDAKWMGPVFEGLGMSVGFISSGLNLSERKAVYEKDVVYVTNNEIGFDYLRDNMLLRKEDKTLRGLNFAVIDEVDSILIDEARTPLVISGVAEDNADLYLKLKNIPQFLREEIIDLETNETTTEGDYVIDLQSNTIELTNSGHEKVEEKLRSLGLISTDENLYSSKNLKLLEMVLCILRANLLFLKNTDYILQNNKIVLIDTNSGRPMPGRRLSGGVHQALEMKENLPIQKESQTLASITFQNFFRLFEKISGMTGTAKTEAAEFDEIYGLSAVSIPTNMPMVRKDMEDKIFLSLDEKFDAVVNEVSTFHKQKRPILIGTISVETSEIISKKLEAKNIKHNVLNAKQNQSEAEIISEAGKLGAVTIATNMAGRGTDIVLGGIGFNEDERQKIVNLGGLHVIGTERHESRRIDNQLRGRSGRQGDPGSSRFFLSLEDPLMKIFAPERIKNLMTSIGGMEKGEAIEHRMLTNAIERAQRRVEGRNFDIRKRILEFDDVLNEQRKIIYSQRNEILNSQNINELTDSMLGDVLSFQFDQLIPEYGLESEWKTDELKTNYKNEYDVEIDFSNIFEKNDTDLIKSKYEIIDTVLKKYESKRKSKSEIFDQVEKQIVLQVIDQSWKNHINELDSLRQNIGFRSYAGKDPRLEYKREAFEMFEKLLETIKSESVRFLTKVEISESRSDHKENSEELINKTQSQKESFDSLLEDKFETKSEQSTLNNEGNRKQRRMRAKAKRKRR
ncbi:MAG: preprotein translocase subunit SecA [Pseudomonadota bacterium]|nr:preprotein translocase subunit SecA [Pseudomonadota bacterium]